jgi:hypothetical protein
MGSRGVDLKLAGASKSTVLVPSLDATVRDLKLEIAKITGVDADTKMQKINLLLDNQTF